MQPSESQQTSPSRPGSAASGPLALVARLPHDPGLVGVLLFLFLFLSLGLWSGVYRPSRWDMPLVALQTAFLQLCLVMLRAVWWPWLLGVSLVLKLGFFWLADTTGLALWSALVGDLACAVGGAWSARLFLGSVSEGAYRRLFLTLVSCAVVGPLCGLALGHLPAAFLGGVLPPPQVWLGGLLAGALGALILAPFPLAWAHSCQAEWRSLVSARRFEALLLAVAVPASAFVIGWVQPRHGVDLGVLMLVPITICAIRFDFPGAAYACSSSLLVTLGLCSVNSLDLSDEILLRAQVLAVLVSSSGLLVAGQIEQLRRRSRQLMGLSDSTTELVASFEVVRDENGRPKDLRFLEVNPAFSLITGYSREIAVGALATKLYGTPTPPHMDELMLMMREGRPISFETFLPKAKRHLKATAFPTDRRNRFSIVATDVTQLRERELDVMRANRMYTVLSEINHAIIRSSESDRLLAAACSAFVEQAAFPIAWAVWRGRGERHATVVATAGEPANFPLQLESIPGLRREGLLTEVCMVEDRSIVCTNFALDPVARDWGDLAATRGFHAAAAFPLRLGGEVHGAICLFACEPSSFSTKELGLLNSAADDLSHALENLRSEEQRRAALSELELSEQRFRLLFDQAPVPYLALDRSGLVADANPAWAALLGQVMGASIGHAFADFIEPSSRRAFLDAYDALVRHGGERSMELQLVPPHGAACSVILALRVEADAGGRFRVGHCIVFNITDRKRYEDAVRISEQRLTQAFEIANDGIWEFTIADHSLYLSRRFYALVGVDPALKTLQFVDWRQMLHPDDVAAFDLIFARFASGDASEFSLEFRLRGGRQRWIWVQTRGRGVEPGPSGKPQRVLGTISDITERRNAEEGLRETALKYRSYIDESPMSICLVAADGLLLETNPAFRQLFGLGEEEPETLALPDLMDPVSTEACWNFIQGLVRQGRGEAELRGQRRRGGLLFLSLQAVGISTGRFLVFCIDTTARRRAEQALHARESMLESILHTALDGFWIIDSRGALLEVNETYCGTSGYSHKELLQMRISDLEAVESPSSLQQHLARIRRQGSERWETSQRRKDSTLIDVEISATYLPVEDGRYVVFLQNISDRKRAETALRQSQRQLSLIIEGSALAAWDWDLWTGEVFCNSHWGRMLGYAEAECSMRRKTWEELIHADDREHVLAALNAHLEGRAAYFDCEYRVRRNDGTWLWVMDKGQVISRDPSGRPLRATGTQRDISSRKQAEERVRQQAALLDQAQDIILAADVSGRVRLCNRSAERFFGLPSSRLEGSLLMDLLAGAEPAVDPRLLEEVLRLGEWLGELRFTSPDHRDRVWDSRWTVVRSPEGASTILVVGTDVSEKRMLESRFLRSQRMESIGAIATGVAHDLNNIFLPISLAANMLRTTEDPSQRVSLHQMIDQSAQRGAEVVRQLLTFGRGMDGRRVELHPGLVLQEIRRIVIETFPRNITTDCRVSEDLWTVNADPTQIHQILLNLCVNARDAMPEGGLLTLAAENIVFDEYYTSMNPEAEAGPYVVLLVGDTGTGISPEHMEKIFDPFFTTKAPGSGTGLGLSTVHGIVKGAGGFVQVRSQPGQGATFKVYLPAIPRAVEVVETEAGDAAPEGAGELLLVVDDEEAVRQSIRHLLESHGYRCLVADDGRQGMVAFVQARERIQGVVTDIMMPGMDGVEMIRAIRRLSSGVPILAMSGLPEKEAITGASDGHADAFLAKPFVSDQLLHAVHALFAAKADDKTAGEGDLR